VQATDDNMTHAHCMLDTQGYKYTHSDRVILFAFSLQQWLNFKASLLLYIYIAPRFIFHLCRIESGGVFAQEIYHVFVMSQ
jgi:hypothetical protein